MPFQPDGLPLTLTMILDGPGFIHHVSTDGTCGSCCRQRLGSHDDDRGSVVASSLSDGICFYLPSNCPQRNARWFLPAVPTRTSPYSQFRWTSAAVLPRAAIPWTAGPCRLSFCLLMRSMVAEETCACPVQLFRILLRQSRLPSCFQFKSQHVPCSQAGHLTRDLPPGNQGR